MKKFTSLISLSIMLNCVFILSYVFGGTWDSNTQTYKPGTHEVVFYEYTDCKGRPYIVFDAININPNEIPRLSVYEWNDRISCMSLGMMTKVTVYEHKDYKGKSSTYKTTTEAKTISGNGQWWNNKISSIKIEKN